LGLRRGLRARVRFRVRPPRVCWQSASYQGRCCGTSPDVPRFMGRELSLGIPVQTARLVGGLATGFIGFHRRAVRILGSEGDAVLFTWRWVVASLLMVSFVVHASTFLGIDLLAQWSEIGVFYGLGFVTPILATGAYI